MDGEFLNHTKVEMYLLLGMLRVNLKVWSSISSNYFIVMTYIIV